MSKNPVEETEETALDVVLNELTRLRTEVGQLKAQIKIKDMQIAELKKTPAQRAQERDELELQEAWERIDSDLTREQQCRDEMMGGHL